MSLSSYVCRGTSYIILSLFKYIQGLHQDVAQIYRPLKLEVTSSPNQRLLSLYHLHMGPCTMKFVNLKFGKILFFLLLVLRAPERVQYWQSLQRQLLKTAFLSLKMVV
jgi:hypothetical protein